ncbi:MAG TPA: hypothetical protein VJR50_11755, partial [Mycobacterium sp.]|nr:hypothetical protein [Mycobacterium sp.]
MGNRFWLWLGAGAVCAGVTVGMLAGAGTAFAQTGSEGADGGTTTSETSEAGDTQQDSVKKTTPSPRPAFGRNAVKAITAVTDAVTKTVTARDTEERATATASTRPRPGRRAAAFVNDVVAAVTQKPDRKVVTDRTRQTNPVDEPEPAATAVDASETPVRSMLTLRPPAPAQPNIATAAPRPQIDVPPVISAIGTAVFNLISFGEALIEGPPKALPGSGVTVERSTLKIGDQEVPADWYFPPTYNPDSATPPERIIYLQHGFLARGVFYDYTASYLAKETNSVVVAPTLTSNIFATDGMWLGGDQMHRAAADLFNDDNTALLESARAAGYTQNQLPANVILIGHSLGGGFAIDTARYMKRNQAQGLSTYYNLAGVVMLDGVSFTDPVAILEDPALDGVPIYNLSATPYPWNLFGTMDAALAQVRPGEFTGAQMLFGFHSDAMVGGNPLIQLGAYLLTGYGGPANVAGSQILASGWINDLFNGNEASGFYGEPGDTI